MAIIAIILGAILAIPVMVICVGIGAVIGDAIERILEG